MPWIMDYLLAIVYQFQDCGGWIIVIFLLLGSIVLLIELWGKITLKRRNPEDYPSGHIRDGYVNYWYCHGTEGLSIDEIIYQKRLVDAGLDWILETCLIRSQNYSLVNMKPQFSQIKRVVAAWAGYIQGLRKWTVYRWVIELQDGQFNYLRGWFDPSGFEMRTTLFSWRADTAEEAARLEIQPEVIRRKGFKKTKCEVITNKEVYEALLDQIKSGERDWAGFKWGTDYSA